MKSIRAILLMAVSSGAQAEAGKESLPEQETQLRAVAAREGWEVVDTILIPGHSRVYYNYPEFAEGALRDNIPAPMRMFDHWRKCDFDVFACIDGSRWGREQSIFAEVVIRTIDSGARVFTLKDGYINKGNMRMFVSMAGYSAASEIDELMRRKAFGMRGRAQRGLPTATKLVPFLKYVLDDKGKQLRVEVNEDLRRLWDDLAEAILDGVPWHEMENVLYTRYGHVRPDGNRWRTDAFYDMIMNPAWWGHDAINHQYKDDRRTKHVAPWIWDESQPVPADIQVFRNAHPPVYTGALAAKVKAELWRRHVAVKGHALPNSYRFTGLLVCDSCGCTLAVTKKPNDSWTAYRCMSRYSRARADRSCEQRRTMNDKRVMAYLDQRMTELFDGLRPHFFDDQADTQADTHQLEDVTQERDGLMVERGMLIRELGRAAEDEKQAFRDEIRKLTEQIAILDERVIALSSLTTTSRQAEADTEAQLAEIQAMTLPVFWAQSPGKINQQLHRVFGARRLVVREGEIRGIIPMVRQRRS